jgi:U-box domain
MDKRTAKCGALLRTGARKGQPCGKRALSAGLCGTHLRSPQKKRAASSLLSPSPSPQPPATTAAHPGESSLEALLCTLLIDPITLELLEDPVVTACGHTFGAESMHRWVVINRARCCPLCKRRLSVQHDIFPNLVVRELLLTVREHNRRGTGGDGESSLRRLLRRVALPQFEPSLLAYGVRTGAQLFSLHEKDFVELGLNCMQQRRLLAGASNDAVTAAPAASSSRSQSSWFGAALTYAERTAESDSDLEAHDSESGRSPNTGGAWAGGSSDYETEGAHHGQHREETDTEEAEEAEEEATAISGDEEFLPTASADQDEVHRSEDHDEDLTETEEEEDVEEAHTGRPAATSASRSSSLAQPRIVPTVRSLTAGVEKLSVHSEASAEHARLCADPPRASARVSRPRLNAEEKEALLGRLGFAERSSEDEDESTFSPYSSDDGVAWLSPSGESSEQVVEEEELELELEEEEGEETEED